MNSEQLFDAITEIDEDLVAEADRKRLKKRKKSLTYVAVSLAACLVLAIAVGVAFGKNGLFISSQLPGNTLSELTTKNNEEETSGNEEDGTTLSHSTESTTAEEITEPPTTVIGLPPPEEITGEKTESTTADNGADTTNIHINNGSKDVKPVALSKASYPEQTKYPVLLGQMSPSYDSWWQDIRERRSIEVEADNIQSFSSALMSQVLTSTQDENNIVSPLNIYMALGILAECTDGNSRQQILDALGAESITDLREQSSKIWQKNYRDDGVMKSIMASSLWLNDSILYKKTAVKTIAEKYYASVYSGTMGTDRYNKMLNSWLRDNTGGLLSPNVQMDYDTVMAIATTLLYQTKWEYEFNTSATEKGTFHAPDGEKTVSFMKATSDMYYYWGERFAAINLPLDIGGKMWFILPDEGVDADTIFADSEMLSLISGDSQELDSNEKSKYIEVHMSIPRFDVKSEQNILESIKRLGITDVTDSAKSDFSALATNPEGIFINQMSHGVRVKVDEEGVSAAAYTVLIGAGAPMPPDEEVYFTLDRPFAFAITLDEETVLFAGVVNNP